MEGLRLTIIINYRKPKNNPNIILMQIIIYCKDYFLEILLGVTTLRAAWISSVGFELT